MIKFEQDKRFGDGTRWSGIYKFQVRNPKVEKAFIEYAKHRIYNYTGDSSEYAIELAKACLKGWGYKGPRKVYKATNEHVEITAGGHYCYLEIRGFHLYLDTGLYQAHWDMGYCY